MLEDRRNIYMYKHITEIEMTQFNICDTNEHTEKKYDDHPQSTIKLYINLAYFVGESIKNEINLLWNSKQSSHF